MGPGLFASNLEVCVRVIIKHGSWVVAHPDISSCGFPSYPRANLRSEVCFRVGMEQPCSSHFQTPDTIAVERREALCACEKGLVPRGGDHDLRPFPERMGDGKDECHAKVLRMTASCVLEDTAVLPAMRMQDEYDKQN